MRWASVCALLLAFAQAAAAKASGAESVPGADDVLRRAFANRYELSFTAEVELEIKAGSGSARRRVLRAATRYDDGDYRALGQLIWPNYLRGMTILSISELGGGHQAFVYLPSEERVRRIAFTHRDDAFLGSDLTYEDFERRQISDYVTTGLRKSSIDGENVFVVECTPSVALKYDRVEISIAASDWAILAIQEYRDGREGAFRTMQAPRSDMRDVDGHVIATRMHFESHERGTKTNVVFKNLEAKAVDARLFTTGALAREAELRLQASE